MCGTYLFEDVFSGGQTFSNVYSAYLEDNFIRLLPLVVQGFFKQYFNVCSSAVLRLIREYFAQMETSPLSAEGYKN